MMDFCKKVTAFLCAGLLFVACFLMIGTTSISAAEPKIAATKNTGDFIEYIGGMPSYTPSGENLYLSISDVVYAVDSTVLVSAMVQSEIIGSWNNKPSTPVKAYYEAYKAQAVAAYSFVKYSNESGAAVKGSSIAFRTPHEQTVRLTEQVARQYVEHSGQVAQTFYTASAGLHTQSNQYAWGGSPRGYLQGKTCEYDEEKAVKTYSRAEMEAILRREGYNPTGDPSSWLKIVRAYDDGYMYETTICGVKSDGDDIKNMFGLRSIKASISYNGTFTITTYGHGHGVGLSQIGALGYAKEKGWNYIQILEFYYTGAKVHGASPVPPSPSGKGDVNHDGNIDVKDIISLQNHILGRKTLVGSDFNAADVNSDGTVNVTDIVGIQNHILGRKYLS